MAGVLFAGAGCDSIQPVEHDLLVVESFLMTGESLPDIQIRRTRPITEPYTDDLSTAVVDAEVHFFRSGESVQYDADPGRPGRYVPVATSELLEDRTPFSLDVRWNGERATTHGLMPPRLVMDSISVDVPDRPVLAAFADSLSLNLREGYLYPVEVTIWWTTEFEETAQDSAYWIRARLDPPASFPSAVVGFFLRTEQIVRERLIETTGGGGKRWVGVYGVPVEADTSAMPEHVLRVALLRGNEDYARYASSRNAPDRRAPVSNITGGVGIVTGISLDTRTLAIKATNAR